MVSPHVVPFRRLLALTLVVALAGCADSATAPLVTRPPAAADQPGSGQADFDRYVAIGTSVSMGWRSDGVLAASQQTSWPVLLARLSGVELTTPRIAAPGCGSPLVAPLASGVRLSGEPASAGFLTRVCAPNEPGVTLPAGNVAMNGARTDQALLATPEAPDPNYAPLYPRVLPPGLSQVGAMEAQRPTLVSVELGANEVLGARDGAVVPGQTIVPVASWAPIYHALLDRVQAAAPRAVLVGLIDRAINFPSFRTGAEMWDARATFAPFNVAVSEDCAGSENVLFVPIRVPTVVAEGAARARAGQPPATLSCQNAPPTAPDGSVIRDYVLSAAELALVDAQLAQMNAVIRAEAAQRQFAYFPLGALYDQAVTKPPFSAVTLMTGAEPYGPLVSLDGIHPSAAGAAVLAEAAARALASQYGDDTPPTLDQLRTDPAAGPFSIAARACGGQYTVCLRFRIADVDGARDAPFRVAVDWGDGTPWAPNRVPAAGVPLVVPHAYTTPGTYRVAVTVTDARGGARVTTTTVTVTP